MIILHANGSCSLGILQLVEEAELEYKIKSVDLAGGEQRTEAFLAVNPKGKVPALILDSGALLTEWPAIATYIAAQDSTGRLIPEDPLSKARVYEAVDYIVSTVHMQGFTRMVRPGNFTPGEKDHDAVKARGRAIFDGGLAVMDEALGARDYVVDQFSIADAALFYCENWKVNRLGETLPPRLEAHFNRMLARPATVRAIARSS
ncbi:glutathione S-transferase [Sphingopyxis lindanitolerans]|uniref:Glutathione S-transferase n=1 Tax=Sphingopyxis lindanitolerans TaxID=2054227 RepID=A0A2S8B901_9SPHN|nr:glutathione S-transferase N-terminal domain-containing protein [Sphingopyxis lindanitolerans]PQM28838.1 glutathione S-transferase [Sphingopyxis lindanitolerans]